MSYRNAILVLLVLAAVAFTCNTQQIQGGQECLCQSVKSTIVSKTNIQDIQIYPESDSCRKVEIVITKKTGGRYCLDSELPFAKKLIRVIRAKNATSSA